MRYKLGNTILNQRALTNAFWIFLFPGIYLWVNMEAREGGDGPVPFPIVIPFILIAVKLIRGIRQGIENEEEL